MPERVEEVKQIVYSGNAIPKGYFKENISTQPSPSPSHSIQPMNGGEKPLFDMNKSIYPPKISSERSIKSNKSQTQGKIIKTIHRPLNQHKNGLSLREMKYGGTIQENDNISVRSTASVKSIKSVNSDEFTF